MASRKITALLSKMEESVNAPETYSLSLHEGYTSLLEVELDSAKKNLNNLTQQLQGLVSNLENEIKWAVNQPVLGKLTALNRIADIVCSNEYSSLDSPDLLNVFNSDQKDEEHE